MIKEINYKQLLKMISEGAELIDVREMDEILEGEIEGSKNWPLSTFGLRQKDVSKNRPTIFYCRSGLRSLKAAEIAERWTEQTVYSLQGGYIQYETERQKSPSFQHNKEHEKSNEPTSARDTSS